MILQKKAWPMCSPWDGHVYLKYNCIWHFCNPVLALQQLHWILPWDTWRVLAGIYKNSAQQTVFLLLNMSCQTLHVIFGVCLLYPFSFSSSFQCEVQHFVLPWKKEADLNSPSPKSVDVRADKYRSFLVIFSVSNRTEVSFRYCYFQTPRLSYSNISIHQIAHVLKCGSEKNKKTLWWWDDVYPRLTV